ncbi:MAG: diguanylate cyclase [Sulfuricurvum sp.]|nr:diguanylate cyclase [Sulfuricurvum sp.]
MNLLYGLSAAVVLGSLSFSYYLFHSRRKEEESQRILQKLHLQNQAILEAVPDLILQVDTEKRYTWANKEGIAFFGEDVIGKEASFFFEGEQDTYEIVNPLFEGDDTLIHLESWQRRHDGKKRLLAWWCRTLKDENGKVTGILSTARDITEEHEKEEALQLSEKKYRNLVENAMIGVYRSDLFGNILYVNQALAGMLAFDSPDELIGQNSVLRYTDPEQRAKFIQSVFQKHHINNYEMELLDKTGISIPVLVSATVEGDILSGMIIDMRELKKSREEIDKLSKVIEQIDDAVVITNKYGTITYVNEAFSRHTGYTREYVLGKTPRMLKSDKHDEAFYRELWQTILRGEVFRGTIINTKQNGDLFYENKTITPLKDDKNNIVGFVSSGKDVTQERLLQQEIEKIATIDKLTGLYNRHKFEKLFVLEAERSHRFLLPLSMILIDIDHFKLVNDTYGHDIGDEVLKHLVKTIQGNIRKIDIFARWGGEEFLILCPGTDLKHTRRLAEKLRLAVDHASFPEIGHVTISLGMSRFEQDDTFSELFKRADQGLYYAKEHGRNQVGSIAVF